MRKNSHAVLHHRLRQCLRFVTMFLAGMAISASAQAPGSIATKPAQAKTAGHERKATLRELYEMFFTFAAHVEARADADTKLGRDMSFYRFHLQKASGLGAVEYEHVLAAAQRFTAVDADVKSQLSDLIKDAKSAQLGTTSSRVTLPAGYKTKINSLLAQKTDSLTSEIANVRQALGEERTNTFEAYLQTKYVTGRIGAVSPARNSLKPRQGKLRVMPNDIVFNSGNSCSDDFDLYDDDDDYFGYWNICADAQISYLGSPESDEAEFYASISWDTSNVIGDWDITSDSTEGDFFVDGVEDDGLDCSADGTNCKTDAQLTSPSGTSYDWNSTGYVTLDFDDDCDGYCFEDSQLYTSDDASVVIYYPDINTLSQDAFDQGSSGSFTVDGEYLMSAFENPPTVTVADQSAIFSKFDVTPPGSYPDGDITITYTVVDTAPPGTYALTVNNGFGSDSYDLVVNAPPTITGISVNGVANAPLQGDTTQTVTLTGTNFGTDTPTITVATDGQYVTAGAVSAHSATSASFSVTTALDAPNGTASFELTAANGHATSPSVAVDAVVLPAPQIMMVTSAADQQTCTGGTEIDGQTTAVYAGQAMLLCSPAPVLPPGAVLTSPAWSVINQADLTGGYCAPGAYTTCTTAGAGQELSDPVMTGVTNVSFYWVNPDSSEVVTFQYCINNSTTQCISTTATFTINGPTQTPGASGAMWTTTSIVTVSGPPYLAFGDYNAAGKLITSGISFFDGETAPAGNAGSFQWVQVINTDEFQKLLSPTTQLCVPNTRKPTGPDPEGNPELDNYYPYPMNASPNTNDAPGSGLGTEGEQQHPFSATMFLMWDPALNLNGTACTAASDVPVNGVPTLHASNCSGSIPIPLASVTWEWAGCAVNTLNQAVGVNGWSIQAGCVNWIPSTSVGPNGSYPQWTYTSLNQTAGGPDTWTCSNVVDEGTAGWQKRLAAGN